MDLGYIGPNSTTMKRIGFLFCMLLMTAAAFAQPAALPFADEIRAFKKSDSLQVPPKNAILFVGSSSFRMWQGVQADFPGYTIINRGFGGSSLPDVIRYASDIIFPYAPKQVVIYCGENDLAGSDKVGAKDVYDRFTQLFYLIRNGLPKASIVFVSLKPSPSRQHLKEKVVAANTLIRNFLKKQKRAAYVDVYNPMLGPDGQPMADLFLADRLHMNAKGYAIWKKQIRQALLK